MSATSAYNKKAGGYIAVTSAIFIAFLIVVISSALAFSTYVSRFNVFGSEAKEASSALAEACADTALLKLAQNPSYAGTETLAVSGSSTCSILGIAAVGQQKTITATSSYQGSISEVRVVVNESSSIAIVSWEETL